MAIEETNPDKMKKVSKIVACILDELVDYIKPGISTDDIDQYCKKRIEYFDAKSACLNYFGFPKHICTSVNKNVCHGIPRDDEILVDGDIISVDVVIVKNEHHGDSCRTYAVGSINRKRQNLIESAYETMWKTIEIIRPGISVGDLGYTMEEEARNRGYNVVQDFCGHGIGKKMHQKPQIPFFGEQNTGPLLKAGMFITIEPMLVDGSSRTTIMEDQWTATCKGDSAQFEHTVYVTKTGYEVLTFSDFDRLNNKKQTN